jgi:HAE1 family hydrophobic/amphiphilic exporter-1
MTQRLNWVSRFMGFFLARTQISIVLLLFIIVGGTTALLGLRREGFPQVPAKVVVVSTVYKGAAPTEVEHSITDPIEASIKDLKEVKSIQSTSADSHSSVIVTLDEKSDADAGLRDITSRVTRVDLPKEADKPEILQPSSGNSAFTIGLTGNFSDEALLEQGRLFEREVSQVKGVKQVKLVSQFDDQVIVTLDPAKVASSGADVSKLSSALAAQNLNFPAGQDLTIDGSRATALLAGRYTSVDDLAGTAIPTVSGQSVTLGSIATIERRINQDGRINHIGTLENGIPVSHTGISYNVDIRSDADILNVNKTLTDALTRAQSDGTLSKDLKITRLYDDAAATSQQIDEIKAGAIGEKWNGIGALGYVGYLVGGVWLLMLAMFMFVNVRAALIAGIAIPLSFLVTLMALYFTGITLNTLTLFSMILVLGLVVDPAIVVIESIQRYKDMGYSGREGAMMAVNSIGHGLFMATLCSIIVFTPFGIVSGVFGEIIKFIPITVIPALIASFFIPLVFLAPMAGRFIKSKQHHEAHPVSEEEALWAASRWFKRANLFILRRIWLQILIMLFAVTVPIGVTAYLFATGHVKSAQFSKPHDAIAALASVSYPASLTDSQVQDLAKQTEQSLSKHPEIQNYYYFQQSSTGFMVFMNLIPIKDRTTSAEDLAAEIKGELPHDASRQIYASAERVSVGPPINDFPVQVQVYDPDLAKLKTFALALADRAKHTSGVIRVSDGYTDAGTNSIQIQVNRDVAAARGLNPAIVGAQLAGLLGQQDLTKLSAGDNQIDVVAAYKGADKYDSIQALKSAVIQGPSGPIKLGDIASFTTAGSSGVINHQNGLRYALVRAQIAADADQFKVQKDINDWASSQKAAYHLRSDALESKGEGDDIAKSFTNLFAALGIALVMIYLVLALFFNSFLKPLIITFALPLSFLGVFPILAVLNNEFGFLEILGLITLTGVVVNVGIFVIDYANHRVAEGMPVKEAIAQATAVRFRPIFLTKVTALGSLLPLAILSPFWRGLNSVIIAGILTSGVLSLFTTPILYTWFDKLSRLPAWIRSRSSSSKKSEPIRAAAPVPATKPASDPE